MRLGTMKARLGSSVAQADGVWWFQPAGLDWSLDEVVSTSSVPSRVFNHIDELVENVAGRASARDLVVVMSNGSFEGVHERLLAALEA